MRRWFLAYTKPKHENNVDYRLTEAGFETLNPKIKEKKARRGKVAEVVTPLFPCYLFVRFDPEREHHLMKYTRGIKRILSGENGPFPLADELVGSISARMENGVITVKPKFGAGEAVMIMAGPFAGLEAVFEREMNGMERVSVLLKSLRIRVIVEDSLISRC